MKNTTLTPSAPARQINVLAINNDQANTLLDLINDQIRAQRVYLRSVSFRHLEKTHISALTHFRNLKRILLKQEAEARRQEEAENALTDENIELFQMFNA